MALKLANAFDTSIEFWLNLQQNAENQGARIEHL